MMTAMVRCLPIINETDPANILLNKIPGFTSPKCADDTLCSNTRNSNDACFWSWEADVKNNIAVDLI